MCKHVDVHAEYSDIDVDGDIKALQIWMCSGSTIPYANNLEEEKDPSGLQMDSDSQHFY